MLINLQSWSLFRYKGLADQLIVVKTLLEPPIRWVRSHGQACQTTVCNALRSSCAVYPLFQQKPVEIVLKMKPELLRASVSPPSKLIITLPLLGARWSKAIKGLWDPGMAGLRAVPDYLTLCKNAVWLLKSFIKAKPVAGRFMRTGRGVRKQ